MALVQVLQRPAWWRPGGPLLPHLYAGKTYTGHGALNKGGHVQVTVPQLQWESFAAWAARTGYGQPVPEDDASLELVERLRKRAEIRRQIPGRKSVQNGEPDRIADLLEEAAAEIRRLRLQAAKEGVLSDARQYVAETKAAVASIQNPELRASTQAELNRRD